MPKKNRKTWNSLKKIILAALAEHTWVSTPLLQQISGIPYPLAGYMAHLAKWKLVLRRGWASRPIYWRISAKGRDRLAWLRAGEGKRSGR
jgi:RIO-like serine/threonine protein kinase